VIILHLITLKKDIMKKITTFFLSMVLFLILFSEFSFAQRGIEISFVLADNLTVGTKKIQSKTPLQGVVINAFIVINGKEFLIGNKLKSNEKGIVVINDVKSLLSKKGVDFSRFQPPYELKFWVVSFTPDSDFPQSEFQSSCLVSSGNEKGKETLIIPLKFPWKVGSMSGPFSQSLSNIEDNG
jgi:hypothetical protein